MKFITLLFFLAFSYSSFGQQKQRETVHVKTLKGELLPKFIDSLKLKILQDTIKFKRSDLIHSPMGTRNTKSYLPYFYVDMRYSYKLDIINGTLVKEFVDNILDYTKIYSIDIVDTAASQALFGMNGLNGAILITTKKKMKVNYQVAGLLMTNKKKYGNNFSQRKEGEIIIAH